MYKKIEVRKRQLGQRTCVLHFHKRAIDKDGQALVKRTKPGLGSYTTAHVLLSKPIHSKLLRNVHFISE